MTNDTHSARAAEPVGPYPHAKRVGQLLFLSGIGPRKRGSREIPGVSLRADGQIAFYDLEAQFRSMCDNLRAVLEDAGSDWTRIVDVTTFLTNMAGDFAIYNKLYAEYFAGAGKPNPTRTTIEINKLPTPIAIEMKVIATIG
ncbi:MAG: RidA family protein [Phycisphaerales bacterium]|nr:RidA family protein [Phycisphaerales bacterium]